MKARKEVKAMREAQQDQEAAEKQPEEEANKEEIDISKGPFALSVSVNTAMTLTILFSL